MAFLFVSALRTEAKDCPACGAENMPDLIMLCPECGANMHDYAYEKKRNRPFCFDNKALLYW